MGTFTIVESTHEEVKKAEESFILKLYAVSNFKSLNEYRYITTNCSYKRAIGRSFLSSSFQLANLAPTSAAAKQNSYRIYLVVQKWMNDPLPPTEWVWQSQDGTLAPVETDILVATDTFLNIVSCGCQPHGGDNMTSSSKKLGLLCMSMCNNCIGQSCNNITRTLDVSDEDTTETVDDISVQDISPNHKDIDD